MLIILSFVSEYEKDKFEYIYEKYKRLLWFKANDILKDHALSEDAVSEAFIRVYRHLHKIDCPDSNQTAAFLVTIVKNIAINMYNRGKKMPSANLDDYDYTDDFDLEEYVAINDEADRMMGLLDKLSEDMKAVFLLKYAHDLSHKEIGAILDITENNVTVRIHRCKQKLKQLVKEVQGHE